MFLLLFQEVRLIPDGSLFIHIALILLMIWILNRTFFRPINNVIQSRERNKGGRSSEAQEILKNVGEKQTQYDAAMLKARSEGYELIEKERAAAVAEREAKVGAVKEEVAQLVERENAEIERQNREAKTAIAREADQMAERISQTILR